jgi:hypothetical protein
MEAADALQTFAEISVGVVGFSAVVVAISPSVVVRDSRRLSWGMALLFGWGLAALFFSALPFILFYLGVPELVLWRVGLLVMGGTVGIGGAAFVVGDQRLNRAGLDLLGNVRDAPLKTTLTMKLAAAVYVITSGALLAAGLRFPVPGVYLAGMTVMLALSLWVLMVFYFLSDLLVGRHRKPRNK